MRLPHSACRSVLTGAEFFHSFSSRLVTRFLLQKRSGLIAGELLRNGSYGREFLNDSWSKKEGLLGGAAV